LYISNSNTKALIRISFIRSSGFFVHK